MSKIRPFAAIRPHLSVVHKVASVPYDVVDREEAAALAQGNPLSFLRVSRAEIDLPKEQNPYGDEVYSQAAANYKKLLDDGQLIREEQPCLYVYQLQMGDQVQTGVAAAYSVDEYDADKIKKHEKTRREKEDDRTRHIVTLRAQTGPVFLTYRGRKAIDEMIERIIQGEPLYNLTAADGVRHTVWKVIDPQALVDAFAEVPELYIADGHHRAASASRTRAQLRQEAGSNWNGDEPGNYFLAVAFPADQLRILPYNRVIKDLNGHSPEDFLNLLKKICTVTEGAAPSPKQRGQVSMVLGGKWYGLELKVPADAQSPSDKLDVAILQAQVLDPLLGINDPRTDKRIDFSGGIRGTGELEKRVQAGEAVAFSMFPTSVEELMAISDANEIMPPKSTWFEPKLRDALLIHQV
ncbi:MAG: DUF1015 domain-containing protein [Candidatus Eremiobacteraeota bacterium]|nr:DUF1015 domain-containing protein [Candidatus Eremiobacteraeota bacterium]MCW5868880.1 DUF1015 domain-containing protein [Candidatus Eremiobacteraeota bacterium]